MQFLTQLVVWLRHQWDLFFNCGFPVIFWVRPARNLADVPDQTGKVALVTGGNSGTGYATSLALYNAGAKVYLACRNEEKAQKAIEEIKKGGELSWAGYAYSTNKKNGQKKGTVQFVKLDLTDLESVERCASEILKREDKLDLLFANAGVMATQEGMYTKQGYTLQFGTNVLGHQRLVSHLLPLLLNSPPTEPARVIFTSSAGHAMAPKNGVDYHSVIRASDESGADASAGGKPKQGKNEYSKWIEYGQSKWGDVALARYLHNEYGRQGRLITASVHPGLVATNLADHLSMTTAILKWAPWLGHAMTRSPKVGASNQVWIGTMPDHEARWLSGEYIVPYQKVGQPRPDVEDNARCERLWEWCEEQGKKWA
ncbi:hypothetical protein IAU60_003924 [Kwoniella sp. DSM 27419]